MRSRLLALAAAISLLAGAPTAMAVSLAPAQAAAPSASRPCGTLASPHRYTHVIWVWMENHSYNTIIGSPQARYINSLAARCGLATNYHNITHPSLPNYVGATSGLGFPRNHYSLLGTTEQLLHLPGLGRASAFPTMTSAFRL